MMRVRMQTWIIALAEGDIRTESILPYKTL